MLTIKFDQLDSGRGHNDLFVNASEIGFEWQEWPEEIEIVMPNGARYILGDEAGAHHNRDGHLERVEYSSRHMCVTVYNDFCADCGAVVEYVNDAWQHVDPKASCFLYGARK